MKKTNSNFQIVNAIIWAALMIASALLFKGHHNASIFLMLMITGFIATQGLIQEANGDKKLSARQEFRCLKRLISGNSN